MIDRNTRVCVGCRSKKTGDGCLLKVIWWV